MEELTERQRLMAALEDNAYLRRHVANLMIERQMLFEFGLDPKELNERVRRIERRLFRTASASTEGEVVTPRG